jgi:phage shock protein C
VNTKLTRSRTDKVIGGVCGGLGAHLKIDPVLIRIFFVLLTLGNGIGLLLYFVLWLVIPLEGAPDTSTEANLRTGTAEMAEQAQRLGQDVQQAVRDTQVPMLMGVALIAIGVVYLVRNLDIPWLRWLEWGELWPLLLILAGVVLLWRRARGG